MLLTIISKEILNNLLSFRFLVTVFLFFSMIVGSMILMGSNYDKQLKDYETAVGGMSDRIRQISSIMEFEAMGMSNSPKPNPLSIFAMGLEPEMSRSINSSGWQGVEMGGSRYANPIFKLFASPDLAYVVNVIISLLAILFVFDAISGEKEEQTLKLMLSNPVPRHTILLSKLVGGYVSLTVPFLLATGVGLLAVLLTTRVSLGGDQWLRVLCIVGVSLVYMASFFTLGLLISASTTKSGTSLMFCLFVWVVLVLGVPNVVPIIAKRVVPTPSATRLAAEERAIEREEWSKAWQSVPNPRELSREERDAIQVRTRDAVNKRTDVIKKDVENRIVGQANLARTISRISPSACYVYAATALSGAGINDYVQRRKYVEVEFADNFRNSMQRIRETAEEFGLDDFQVETRIGEALFEYDVLPLFEPPTIPVVVALKDAAIDLMLLGIACVLFFMLSFLRFLRYDVN
jgi:ABC-type transport system involved in multi-copper enzyme maturation permease subunit